jgi:hypothetical protein
MADGLAAILHDPGSLEAEAAFSNLAELVIFAHAWIMARIEQSRKTG